MRSGLWGVDDLGLVEWKRGISFCGLREIERSSWDPILGGKHVGIDFEKAVRKLTVRYVEDWDLQLFVLETILREDYGTERR